ncbi:MAG: M23 family metallopeptidase, partial [Oscillospiraceae bacterium]
KVVKVSYNTMRGKYIIIDHGGGIRTTYMHNSATYVKLGQFVEQGNLIAAVGRTGNATGNHLHIEFTVNGRIQDPEKYINTKGKVRKW